MDIQQLSAHGCECLLCAALLSFDGIQYSYMAPDLFSEEYFVYAERHLRILSGLYGILEPFDGVVPYRLELDSPFHTPFAQAYMISGEASPING